MGPTRARRCVARSLRHRAGQRTGGLRCFNVGSRYRVFSSGIAPGALDQQSVRRFR